MFRKALSLGDCEIKLQNNSTRFSGYASTFGKVDLQGDLIMKGAYSDTLRKYGIPKMLLQHESSSLPIGKWVSVKEDDHGLLVEGEFTPGLARAEETRAALRHGTVDGLSIGYLLQRGDYEDGPEGRVINRVSRLLEISVVTFPADTAARVDLESVKKEEIEQLETVRDLERFLRNEGLFNQATAKRLVAKLRELVSGDEEEKDSAEKERFEKITGNIFTIFSRAKPGTEPH
ncbi:prohead peptidase. Unknown type peptidase. MEROPS family U35 [Nitrosospira multiformis]|uniref:Prohead serine protease domain-containing protein n=1 Tax=Nitrosospira multiformis TaxID=1231 RepID=A0A1H8Q376_9PROT|nr:HK97 family phage prohead protease [Nitrosospira multiformis]SEO48367.1 prohead peptidase. Unknown type peptidase. MEROPS family U35 [Nitrosospira multiformis]